MRMSKTRLNDLWGTPRGWLKVLEQTAEPRTVRQPEELESIWEHQLSASAEFDFDRGTATADDKTTAVPVGNHGTREISNFRELFQDPNPPLELLMRIKEFAKANRGNPESLLPDEISAVLYYASIFVALVRCGQRISRLEDSQLRQGAEWVLAQPWVDEATKGLFREGSGSLRDSPGSGI